MQPLSGLKPFSHGAPGQDRRPSAPRRSDPGLDYTILSGLAAVQLGEP